MTHKFEKLPDEPIGVITYSEPVDFQEEPSEIIRALIEHEEELQYVIHDIRELKFSFSDLVLGLAASFRPNKPELRSEFGFNTVVVGSNTLIKLAVQSVRQVQYGGRELLHFDTLDEALTHIKDRLQAKEAS